MIRDQENHTWESFQRNLLKITGVAFYKLSLTYKKWNWNRINNEANSSLEWTRASLIKRRELSHCVPNSQNSCNLGRSCWEGVRADSGWGCQSGIKISKPWLVREGVTNPLRMYTVFFINKANNMEKSYLPLPPPIKNDYITSEVRMEVEN